MKFQKVQRFLITVIIAVGFFYVGYTFGTRSFLFEYRKNPPQIQIVNQYSPDNKTDFSLFWDVWDLINQTYLERPVDPHKMMLGAIEGVQTFLSAEAKQSSGSSPNAK